MGFISDLITNVSAFRIKIGEKLLILKAAINLKANIDGSNIPPQTQWANLHAGGLDGYVFHGGQVGSNFNSVFVEVSGGIFQTDKGGFRTWLGITEITKKKEDAWIHSHRYFTDGTLIETDIDYSQTQGEEFLLEIKGNTYFDEIPLMASIQGYIYNGTLINCNGFSTLPTFFNILALNLHGKLHFWFPRLNYWHGFSVKVNAGNGGGGLDRGKQRCISITNFVDPGGTKRVNIPIQIISTRNWTEAFFAKQTGYYPSLQVGQADNAAKWNGVLVDWASFNTNPIDVLGYDATHSINRPINKPTLQNWLEITNKANTNGSNTTGGSWKIDYILSDVLQGAVGNGQIFNAAGNGYIYWGNNFLNGHIFQMAFNNGLRIYSTEANTTGQIWHEFNFDPNSKVSQSQLNDYVNRGYVNQTIYGIKEFHTEFSPSYTSDGLFDYTNISTQLRVKTFSGQILFGYKDYGTGQYFPRIGFDSYNNVKWDIGIAWGDFTIGKNNDGNALFSINGSGTIGTVNHGTSADWIAKVSNLNNATGIGFANGSFSGLPYFYHPTGGQKFLASIEYINNQDFASVTYVTNAINNAVANIPVHNGQLTVNTTADLVGGFTYLPSGNLTTTLGLSTAVLNAIADGVTAYSYGNHATQGYLKITDLAPYETTVSVNNKLTAKQDKLIAGANVSIVGNTISATDTDTVTRIGVWGGNYTSGDINFTATGAATIVKNGNNINIDVTNSGGIPNPGVEVLNFSPGAHTIANNLAMTIVRCTAPGGVYTFDLTNGKYDGDEICITTCGFEYNIGGELLSMCGTSGFGSSTASRWIWADQLAKWVQVG